MSSQGTDRLIPSVLLDKFYEKYFSNGISALEYCLPNFSSPQVREKDIYSIA